MELHASLRIRLLNSSGSDQNLSSESEDVSAAVVTLPSSCVLLEAPRRLAY